MMRMKREDRIEAVSDYMYQGHTRVSKITRMLNKEHGTLCKTKTIAEDMKEVRRRHETWADMQVQGDAPLRAERWHKYLVRKVDLLDRAIDKALIDDQKGPYKAAQLMPQLLATIQAIWDLEEKFPMYQSNARLHARLKEKEAELDRKLAEAGAIKAEDGS